MTASDASQGRRSRWATAVLCLGALLAAITLERLGSRAYAVILGISNPVILTAMVAVFGYAGLQVIERSGFAARVTVSGTTWAWIIVAGCLLPVPVIVVDLLGGFGPDINAPLPEALLFYPSIALMAEMVFHVAPLVVMAGLAAVWSEAETRLRQAGYVVAILIEPAFQVIWGAGRAPMWANIPVGIQLLVFSGIALFLIRRYGFLTAYVFRVAYYSVWHILWGYARLEILF